MRIHRIAFVQVSLHITHNGVISMTIIVVLVPFDNCCRVLGGRVFEVCARDFSNRVSPV